MVCLGEQTPARELGGGVRRKVIASGGSLMAVEFHFERGAVGALHSHPHQQVGYVVSGRFRLTQAGQPTVIGPGDSYYVPSGEVHGVEALEDGVLLDVFTPWREDFLV